MARIADVVKDATKELAALVKEARDSEEDDLTKLAELFDRISQRADETANTLASADEALSGSNGDDQQTDQYDEPTNDDGSDDEPPKKKQRT